MSGDLLVPSIGDYIRVSYVFDDSFGPDSDQEDDKDWFTDINPPRFLQDWLQQLRLIREYMAGKQAPKALTDDYYKVLGIFSETSAAKIKKSGLRLLRQLQPGKARSRQEQERSKGGDSRVVTTLILRKSLSIER